MTESLSSPEVETRYRDILRGISVIHLDDDPNQGILLKQYLKGTDCRFQTVITAEDVLELLGRESCDLLILDIMMPGLDGWALFDQIRGDEKYADLPVIFVTCLVNRYQEAVSQDLERHCLTLAKPVDKDRFRDAVLQLLDS